MCVCVCMCVCVWELKKKGFVLFICLSGFLVCMVFFVFVCLLLFSSFCFVFLFKRMTFDGYCCFVSATDSYSWFLHIFGTFCSSSIWTLVYSKLRHWAFISVWPEHSINSFCGINLNSVLSLSVPFYKFTHTHTVTHSHPHTCTICFSKSVLLHQWSIKMVHAVK